MHSSEALLDIHERTHRNLESLLVQCGALTSDEIDREMPGFGYPTVRLQLHHAVCAQRYWLGVLQGRIDVDDDAPDYPTIDSLEALRQRVFAATEAYLRAASNEELNTARPMMTWQGRERTLVPAQVILRTQMHLYHHQGQVVAMCRLMGKPCEGLDFPIT